MPIQDWAWWRIFWRLDLCFLHGNEGSFGSLNIESLKTSQVKGAMSFKLPLLRWGFLIWTQESIFIQPNSMPCNSYWSESHSCACSDSDHKMLLAHALYFCISSTIYLVNTDARGITLAFVRCEINFSNDHQHQILIMSYGILTTSWLRSGLRIYDLFQSFSV